jgi:hypothetical protein
MTRGEGEPPSGHSVLKLRAVPMQYSKGTG